MLSLADQERKLNGVSHDLRDLVGAVKRDQTTNEDK
jgi:hypothetical protein